MNDSRCPICQNTEIPTDEYHGNPERLLICDDCQKILMPELSDEHYEFEHADIFDYDGFLDINQY